MSQQTAGHLIDPLSVENQSDLNVRMANLKLPDNFSRDADRLGPRHMAVAGEDQWNCHSPAIVEQSFLQRPAVAFLQEHSLPLDPAIPASASHMENDFGRKSAGGRDHSVADSASPNLPAGLFQLLRIRCGKDCAAYSGTGGEIGNGGIDEPELKIIDVFICKLRKKLEKASGGKNYIETVWGRGYILKDPDEHK